LQEGCWEGMLGLQLLFACVEASGWGGVRAYFAPHYVAPRRSTGSQTREVGPGWGEGKCERAGRQADEVCMVPRSGSWGGEARRWNTE